MKNFIIVSRGSLTGFISTNFKHSVWGTCPKSKLNGLVESLREDYGNIRVSFPKSPDDGLDSQELVAYYKLLTQLQKVELAQACQLKIKFGESNAKI